MSSLTEITDMASEHDCLEPELQLFNNHNSSANPMNTSSKEDLDNLFVHEDSPSISSIIVDTHEAPPVVTTSDEQTSPISLTEADEFNQEDTTDFDGNAQFVPYNPPSREEIESSTTALEPSNVQNFHQVQPSTYNLELKIILLTTVMVTPYQPVMTRQRLQTDSEDVKVDCKSTSGGLQCLGGKGFLFGCSTQLLDYGYQSTIGLRCNLLQKIPFLLVTSIAISCNPGSNIFSKTKHIEIRYSCYYKEHVENVIIMAQQRHAADVHLDELCPPSKRYDLMDANKKVDLEHVQCPPESKILTNIIKNHPLRFSIAASSSVPWIYMAQFWHTLKEDGSKYRLRFMLDKKELTLTLDDFRQIFHLPQATANNHNSFVFTPSFYRQLVPFYIENKVGMQIPAWMITEEMKHMEHYRMYAKVFGIDQSQVLQHIPKRRSTRLTPPAPVPNVDKADEMILQDTLQVSLAEHKSHEEQESRENVALVDEHLASEEIEKMVDRQENIVDDSSIPRNDEPNILGTMIEPRCNKESPEVEITKDKEVDITKETPVVEITNVVIPVNVNDDDEEITDKVYELKRREKGKLVKETRNSPIPTPIRSPRIHVTPPKI
ncbi:hypothetical protein Tco_0018303 [Tanacetum coccineum]